MSLADIQARARSMAGRADPKARARYFHAANNARKLANLKAEGYVIPLSEWLGHNNGPDWFASELFIEHCWKLACEKAWAPPAQEIGVRRARKAEALGVTYKQYVLEILERGRYLDEETAAELRMH
ncbi:MAG: hypothetical protein JSR55_08895 [Proteobacteria bacterium]|nr:hypothetical protein [Pseudomonadota bacterium]